MRPKADSPLGRAPVAVKPEPSPRPESPTEVPSRPAEPLGAFPSHVRFLSPLSHERDDPGHLGYSEGELRRFFGPRTKPSLTVNPAKRVAELRAFVKLVHGGKIKRASAQMFGYTGTSRGPGGMAWTREAILELMEDSGFRVESDGSAPDAVKVVFRNTQALEEAGYDSVDDYISWPKNRVGSSSDKTPPDISGGQSGAVSDSALGPQPVSSQRRFLSPLAEERNDPDHPGYSEKEFREFFGGKEPTPALVFDAAERATEICAFLEQVRAGTIQVVEAGRRMAKYTGSDRAPGHKAWSRARIRWYLQDYGFEVRGRRVTFVDRLGGLRAAGYESVDDYLSRPENRVPVSTDEPAKPSEEEAQSTARTEKMSAVIEPSEGARRMEPRRYRSPFPDERSDPLHPGYTEAQLRDLFNVVEPDPPLRVDLRRVSEEVKAFLQGLHLGIIQRNSARNRMVRYTQSQQAHGNKEWTSARIFEYFANYGFQLAGNEIVFRDRLKGLKRSGYDTVDDYISWPKNRLTE